MMYDPFALTLLVFITLMFGTMNLCWYALVRVRYTWKTVLFAFIPVANIALFMGLYWLEVEETRRAYAESQD